MNNIWIVIPCYNESTVLRTTIEKLLPLGHNMVCVDDGSSCQPSVREMLDGLDVVVVRHPFNMGQGAALQTGMDYARRHGAECVVHFDADGQHRPEQINAFLTAIEQGVDVALGSRFLRQEDLALVPLRKRIVLRLARIVNGLFTGVWLTDAHNGFRALGPRALENINLRENRMTHASEILTQIRQANLRIAEVPTAIDYSEYSASKGQPVSNSFNILIDLILEKLLG